MENKKHQAIVVGATNKLSKLFTSFFECLDFTHESFSSPESALNKLEDLSPRLIILDSSISPEQSCQFIKKIRSSKDGLYVTIVMVVGHAALDGLELVIEAGLDLFWVEGKDSGEFNLWLSTVEKRVRDTTEREEKDQKSAYNNREQEDFNEQLEEAISRANQMTREAEYAYIETNQIFKTIAGGIIVVDANCKLLRCNDTFLGMVNKTHEEAMSAKCYELFHGVLCNSPECPLQVIKKGQKRVESDVEYLLSDGSTVNYHIISTPFCGPVGEFVGIVEHITDITARVEAEKALQESERRYKELSTVDELTGLFNKRYFGHHFKLEVERARRYGRPLSMLLMDIDNFKHHNDTYGHDDGDKVLERLGEVIRDSIRVNDLGCRYGGEEFTIILPEVTGENAVAVAERVRKSFADIEFRPNPDEVVQKTISVGIAQLLPGDDEASFLHRTDQNMYKAKNSGKNKYVYM